MRLGFSKHSSWLVAGLLVLGCKNDDPPASGDGSGTGSSTGAGSSGTTGSPDGDSTAAADQGGSSDDETTAAPPTEVMIGGTIQDYFAMAPIADAQISVLGQPGFETVSDAKGLWTIPGLQVQTFDRFVVADSKNYWGSVVPFEAMLMDVDDFELSQVSLQAIDIQIGALQAQDPTVMVEDGTAVFLVALIQNLATGAVVEVDPPPPPNTYYAPNASGQPILNQNEIQWSVYPVAVVFNLQPGPEGTYEITVTHPERECTVEDPTPPTFARHINLIRVDCPPPA